MSGWGLVTASLMPANAPAAAAAGPSAPPDALDCGNAPTSQLVQEVQQQQHDVEMAEAAPLTAKKQGKRKASEPPAKWGLWVKAPP